MTTFNLYNDDGDAVADFTLLSAGTIDRIGLAKWRVKSEVSHKDPPPTLAALQKALSLS